MASAVGVSEAGLPGGEGRARLQWSGCGRLGGLAPPSVCVAGLDWADPAFPGVFLRAAWKGHGPLSQLGGPRAGVTAALDRLAGTERFIT